METNVSFLLDPEYSPHFTGLMAFLEDTSDVTYLMKVFQEMYPVFLNLKALNAVHLYHVMAWSNLLDLETFLRNLHTYHPSLSKRIS